MMTKIRFSLLVAGANLMAVLPAAADLSDLPRQECVAHIAQACSSSASHPVACIAAAEHACEEIAERGRQVDLERIQLNLIPGEDVQYEVELVEEGDDAPEQPPHEEGNEEPGDRLETLEMLSVTGPMPAI